MNDRRQQWCGAKLGICSEQNEQDLLTAPEPLKAVNLHSKLPTHLLLLASRMRTSLLMSSTAPGSDFKPPSLRETMPVDFQFSRRLASEDLPQQLPMLRQLQFLLIYGYLIANFIMYLHSSSRCHVKQGVRGSRKGSMCCSSSKQHSAGTTARKSTHTTCHDPTRHEQCCPVAVVWL